MIRHTMGEMTVTKTAGSRSTTGIFLILVNQVWLTTELTLATMSNSIIPLPSPPNTNMWTVSIGQQHRMSCNPTA